jgi:hypothetical protein
MQCDNVLAFSSFVIENDCLFLRENSVAGVTCVLNFSTSSLVVMGVWPDRSWWRGT